MCCSRTYDGETINTYKILVWFWKEDMEDREEAGSANMNIEN